MQFSWSIICDICQVKHGEGYICKLPLTRGNATDFSDLLGVILLFIMTAKLISEEIIVMSKLCYNESLQLELQMNHGSRSIKTGSADCHTFSVRFN